MTPAQRISKLSYFLFIASFAISSVMMPVQQAQAQNLPSSQYDDYDYEKYEAIYSAAQANLSRAQEELRISQARLDSASNRENNLRRDFERTRRDLDDSRRREVEIERGIQESQQRQTDLARAIEGATRRDEELQRNLNEAKASVDRNKQIVDGLQADYNTIAAQLSQAQNILNAKQAAYNQADQAVNSKNAEIERLQRELQAAPADQKAAAQARLDQALSQLPPLLTAKSNASGELTSAQNAFNSKNSEAQAAKTRLDMAKAEQQAANNRFNEANRLAQENKNKTQNLRNEYDQARNREQELNRAIIETRRRSDELSYRLRDLDRELRGAIQETQQALYERDAAQAVANNRTQDFNRAQDELNRVSQNIAQARSSIEALAAQQGSMDGKQEGQEVATERANLKGKENGQRDGEASGRKQGMARDYEAGKKVGLVDAEKESAQPKNIQVSTDGYAYNEGFTAGKQFGLRNGTNKSAYAKGRAAGEAQGLANAKRDAIPQNQLGYDKREQEYLTAPLKKVVVGDANNKLSTQFKGLQGQYSNPGDDRYYNPRPAKYPHPRLTRFYQDQYLSSYRSDLESTYTEVYKRVYDRVYTANYNEAEARALAKDYPDSRTLGYNQAYRGFTDGNAVGSEEKGYTEGQDFAYKANIEREKKEAFDAGIARADELYTKNPVIKVVSLSLVDNDRDSIYRPGETAQVITVIRNFGLVAKSDLVMDASLSSREASVVEARATVPQIDPQSETTVVGRQQIKISDSTPEGTVISSMYRLQDAKGEVARQSFSSRVQMPTITAFSGFDGVLIPGEATDVKVVLTNRSKSMQSLSLSMLVDSGKIDLRNPDITVDKLVAGESRTVIFNMTGKQEARFEESSIKLTVRQNNLVFGRLETDLTIIKRHAPTQKSLGLIISANLAKGSGKSLYDVAELTKAGMDTWDLRVDGVVSKADSLAPYAKKAVFVMADAQSGLDAATLANLQSYVMNGGQIVVLGAGLADSKVVDQLSGLLQVKVRSQAGSVNAKADGQAYLAGFTMNARVALLLETAGRKARSALTSNLGIHGVSSFANGYADRVGRMFTLGIDPQDLGAAELQKLVEVIQSMAIPFSEKVEAAKNANYNMFPLLGMDVQDEIIHADLDLSQNYYEKTKNSKIALAIDRLIYKTDKGSDQRRALANLYPMVKKVVNSVNRRNEIGFKVDMLLTTPPGVFYPTWKSLYCDKNGKDPVCN
jgi:hypothetical protein